MAKQSGNYVFRTYFTYFESWQYKNHSEQKLVGRQKGKQHE